MPPFPIDAPRDRVVRALARIGFELRREAKHLVFDRRNADGSTTPLVLPNHRTLKSSTLRTALTQAGIERSVFLSAYEAS